MNMYISVFLLAGVVSLVGYLWLAIVAFKRSVPWGLLVLLLSPITAIVYSLMHWYEAHKAFLVYIVSFLLCAGSAVFIYADVGMGNMQQIVSKVHSGELAPAKAYQLIVTGLAHPGSSDLFAQTAMPVPADTSLAQASPDPTKSSSPVKTAAALASGQVAVANDTSKANPEPAKSEPPKPAPKPVAPATDKVKAEQTATDEKKTAKPDTKEPVQKSREELKKAKPEAKPKPKTKPKHEARIPSINQVPPDPLAQKPKKPEPNSVRVRMEKMPRYLGHYFILTLKNGTEQRGLLRKVSSHYLILDRKLYGGNFQYKVRKTQVKKIHMLTRLPDER